MLSDLARAIQANDAATVRATLAAHPDLRDHINDPIEELGFGATALLGAVQRGNREIIDTLLDAGADIDQKSHWWAGGFGVLDQAEPALAAYLIQRGARVDAFAAARLGLEADLRALIARDPGVVHAHGPDGQTPLHCARTVSTAHLLLDHGADINALAIDHESTPAQYMVREHQDVARALVARGCRTDLLLAVALGDIDLVRRHLDADPASVTLTVSHRHFPQQNLQAGGSIYHWTLGHNMTAHEVARAFGHPAVYDLLWERSTPDLRLAVAIADGSEETAQGPVAISEALGPRIAEMAERNNTRAVSRMLALGWPVDARGHHGATALHWAAFHGNVAMVRELLQHGAPVETIDERYSGTPIGWAYHGANGSWLRAAGDYAATRAALLAAGATP